MYLKEIQIKGFKSFAEKTKLEFSEPDQLGRLPLTAVVGPNGSGKSNIADAVRWVLGEQSIKAVRGKKSGDVIFAGSARRSKSAMAEVQLAVVNDDRKIPVDAEEVAITRRLYRDGQSEYLLNGKTSRLMDIQMLLAKAAFGKEGYSVIGQGQIDQILIATPEERKVFFDEATGVRPLQIKKEHSLKKLTAVEDNLRQALLLEEEIAPRLRSLTRQVKRMERREQVEKDLRESQTKYYGALSRQIEKEYEKWNNQIAATQEHKNIKTKELEEIEQEMEALEKEQSKPVEFLNIQTEYQKFTTAKEKLRDQEFELKQKLLSSKKQAVAVPTYEIVRVLEEVQRGLEEIQSPPSRGGGLDIRALVTTAFAAISNLLQRLKGESTPQQAQSITQEIEKITKELGRIDSELERLRDELQEVGKSAEQKKQSFFNVQRRLSLKQAEIHALETELNLAKIEMAKIETRRDDLQAEAKQEMGAEYEKMQNEKCKMQNEDVKDLLPEIQKLKKQLELIGGVEEETVREYNEVKQRHDFLTGQIDDLEKSLQSLVQLLEGLDNTIKTQFEGSFDQINKEFGNYFRILFGGGQARLSKLIMKSDEAINQESKEAIKQEDDADQNFDLDGMADTNSRQSLLEKFTKKDSYRGVDIYATPPGKKLKSVAMLSGGEKALTSIALLSAILSLNPPPFVVLDEVDAALDESNSARFASILTELANTTQFIVITHNRATMQASEILYGVTMGDDGVSKILSLKFEEAEKAVARG